jgi:hypothetical protein
VNITCTFPNNETPLTNGGAGAGAFVNNVTTWSNPVVATAGSPGHALGPGASGTNDSIAMATGTWGPTQTVTGTIWRTGAPLAAEVELHTRMTQSTGPDSVKSYEYDFTATIMALVRWNGPQGDFTILFNPTVTELVDGDVIKATISGSSTNATLEAFINNVSQGTANDTTGTIPETGSPGIGFDNDAGTFGWKGYTASDGISSGVIPSTGAYQMENNTTDRYLLEDGSGVYLIEPWPPVGGGILPPWFYGDLGGIGSPGRFWKDRLG